MNTLFVKELKGKKPGSLNEISHQLDAKVNSIPVNILNWNRYQYRPDVRFRIGYFEKEIWLKYKIEEKYILALETKTNGEVYKDSCVEFFISIDGKNYYNFEFNCIGTVHLAYGQGRENRQFIDPKIVDQVEIKSSLGNKSFAEKKGSFKWEMIIRIPVTCFIYDQIQSLKRKKATANFYKCGDGTSEPHFVTWNPIRTPNPDFHRPEFFGELFFE